MHACINVCLFISVYVCIICMYVCIHARIYSMQVCVCMYMYACVNETVRFFNVFVRGSGPPRPDSGHMGNWNLAMTASKL